MKWTPEKKAALVITPLIALLLVVCMVGMTWPMWNGCDIHGVASTPPPNPFDIVIGDVVRDKSSGAIGVVVRDPFFVRMSGYGYCDTGWHATIRMENREVLVQSGVFCTKQNVATIHGRHHTTLARLFERQTVR